MDMTRAEVNQNVRERIVYINDKNFDREVLKYDGAVILLVDTSCPAAEDGNLSYYGESITNKENRESSTASFDENGFTKIKLLTNEQYTNGDFSLLNTETNPLIICKKDPLCDINIDQETFTVKGKVKVSSKGNLIYQSKDKNNEAILDFTTGIYLF